MAVEEIDKEIDPRIARMIIEEFGPVPVLLRSEQSLRIDQKALGTLRELPFEIFLGDDG